MRLIYRLNLSFGILLFAVLAITAVLIYPLLSNTLIDSQRKEMRATGRYYLNALQAVPGQAVSNGQMEAIWLQSAQKLLYSQLTAAKAMEWKFF
ncbi:hypothetical protein [Paenibacillus sp. NPDC058174]|uniref:hypothetical protein n=1 Tax=Paenibacillus sp. NPDC058174 TaxID=3346366 RepID=UPI0036DB4393